MSPFLWSKVVRGAASFPGIRFSLGLGIRGNDTTWSGGLLRGGLLQPVQCPTRGQVVRLRPALLVPAEKKFEWKKLLADETKAPASHAQAQDPAWSN
jgi:hypothetical protein